VRRLLPFAIIGGCLGVGVLPALAANQSVAIHDFAYDPDPVAVMPGETVTWQADGLAPHSVHFENEASLGTPDPNFTAQKTFNAAGTFFYYCDKHAYMNGTVYVNATGTVPTTTPSPTATASPTSSPGSGGSGGTPGGGGPTSGPSPSGSSVVSFRLRATVRKRRVTVTLTVGADAAVRVRGTLRRGKRRVRSVTLRARPGRHRVKLPGKALRPGRYTLTLRAGELKRTVRFRVRG
jgi:Copper binding proteins, plastocyanin/azurin family